MGETLEFSANPCVLDSMKHKLSQEIHENREKV